MRYSLRQLEVFLATATHENITRAAESLAMSQSAASSALAELESQYDIRLFDRVGKRLQLNDLGRQLRGPVQALLEQARHLERALSLQAEEAELHIGATLTIGNYLAVRLIADYLGLHPGSRVKLTVANTEEITRRLEHFEFDMAFIEGELNHPSVRLIPWQQDELVVFCAPEHPLAGQGVLSDEDLRGATWILREPGSGTRQAFDRAMFGLLPELMVLMELQHTEAIKRAVEAGLGISCLSRITLGEAFARGSLVPLAVPQRDFSRALYCVLHRQKYLSGSLRQWLAFCGVSGLDKIVP